MICTLIFKKKIRCIIRIMMIASAGIGLMPDAAWALCSASDSTLALSPTPVQRDAPVGTIIARGTITTRISCNTQQASGEWRVSLSPSNIDEGSTSLTNVRKTNKSGVGIRWMNTNAATGTSQYMSKVALNDPGTYRGLPQTITTNFTDVFELVKIGTISTGVLPSLNLAYDYRNAADRTFGRLINFKINDTLITSMSCGINSTAISVPMGTVKRKDFKGSGTWPEDTDTRNFNISLNCSAGTSVNFQIEGNAQNASQGILSLNGGAESASGVGIQLLHNNSPLPLSTMINTGTAGTEGEYSIPLQARYYQTQSTVTPGIANSSATFTLTYQ